MRELKIVIYQGEYKDMYEVIFAVLKNKQQIIRIRSKRANCVEQAKIRKNEVGDVTLFVCYRTIIYLKNDALREM